MEENETLVVCTHRNAVKCRVACSHREPHVKKPTDNEEDCTYTGDCTNVREQVQCEEIKV